MPRNPDPHRYSAPRLVSRSVLLLLALLLALPAAWSRSADRQQPVEIDADHFEGSEPSGISRFSGNFRLVQGSLLITADQATVYQQDGEVVRVVLEGRPATLRQQLDDGSWTEAEALRMEYLRGEDAVLLEGRAEVRQQSHGTLRAERLRYDIASGRLLGGGDGPGGRVRMTIPPRVPREN